MWTSQTKYVVIVSKLYINKLKQVAKLLAKWSWDIATPEQKVLSEELRYRKRPQIQLAIVKDVSKLIINKNKRNTSIKNKKLEISNLEVAMSKTEVNSQI